MKAWWNFSNNVTWCWNRMLWDMCHFVPVVEKTAIYCFDIACIICVNKCALYIIVNTRQLIMARMRGIMTHPGVEWEVSAYLTCLDNRQIAFFPIQRLLVVIRLSLSLFFYFLLFSIASQSTRWVLVCIMECCSFSSLISFPFCRTVILNFWVVSLK